MNRIDRKNRERRGGMESSALPKSFWGDGIVHYTPVQRAFIKRQGKKAIRRQQQKAVAESMQCIREEEEYFDSFWNTPDEDGEGYMFVEEDNFYDEFPEPTLEFDDFWLLKDDYF